MGVRMTTILCLHPAIAQKSYGNERRWLCPPPFVQIESPLSLMGAQDLIMGIGSEADGFLKQTVSLSDGMGASFKSLYITGKMKSVRLSLQIAEKSGRAWANFSSSPITLRSKPSKNTATTRTVCPVMPGCPVSLFNRINSQALRTKYMTIDDGSVSTSNVSWAAFNVEVVSRPTQTQSMSATSDMPILYGSCIILSDPHSGISTTPLLIRKVTKGRVSLEDGGEVGQMQRVALQRFDEGSHSSREYLSAGRKIFGPQDVVRDPLVFEAPRGSSVKTYGVRVVTDLIDDYLCWTIVGIAKFQYTFFDALNRNCNIPDTINPFPMLLSPPIYRQPTGRLELTVANFLCADEITGEDKPLDVYFGSLGPVPVEITPRARFPNTSTKIDHVVLELKSPAHGRFFEIPSGDGSVTASGCGGAPIITGNMASPVQPTTKDHALPILFIRPNGGVGYHSGQWVFVSN
ncbi:beta-trefoil DNA-binding domain-containing protein [Mycena galericulata]|nr:beta-trefoil DNA-binding domain-containing protein [Mycena galericulata]